MICLDTNNGDLVVVIDDAKGDPQVYRVEAKAGGLQLSHTTSGKVYDLKRTTSGWECTCRSYQYRQRRNETDCKHVRCCLLLQAVAITLEPSRHREAVA